jgi:hypothetical protein
LVAFTLRLQQEVFILSRLDARRSTVQSPDCPV